MGVRVSWQDRYTVSIATSMTASAPDFGNANYGVEGDGVTGTVKFLLPVTEHSHLTPGNATLDNEMALGLSERHSSEYTNVTAEPSTVTLTMPLDQYNLSFFAGMLFQAGATEAAGGTDTQVVTCIPYVSADPDKFCTVVRQLTDATVKVSSDTSSHILSGCIATSLTISGEEGNLVFLTVDLMGYAWNISTNATGEVNSITSSTNDFTWASIDVADSGTFVKYEDVLIKLAGSTFTTPNFSCTFSNNAVGQLYNSNVIQQYILGRLTVEGSFRIPYGAATVGGSDPITKFQDGTVQQLQIGTGSLTTNSTDGEWNLNMRIQYTDTGFGGDNELGSDMSFSGLKDGANTLAWKIGYDSDTAERGW